jgi:hypothetical protein
MRPQRSTKVTKVSTPNTGNAAARRIALEADTTRVALGNLALLVSETDVLYYAFGAATVDCTGVASADGFVMPSSKESGIPVPSGSAYLSLYAGADFDVLVEEGVTTP